MKRLVPCMMVLVAGLALPAAAQRNGADKGDGIRQNQPLPIKSLTLYRSGVGSFERRGMVDAGQTIQLRFATDQINDMLKSMVILDQQQALQSVAYGSKEPLDRRLASFGVNIADNPPMNELLNRLRGSKVKIKTDDGETSGIIVNVESRPTVLSAMGNQGATQTVSNLPWINLMTESGVQSINLTKARGFELLDAALAAELNKALGALAEHRADRVKSVDLTFAGNGARPVVIEYVHEMPVWKTSYRLVLPESPQQKDSKLNLKDQLTIQGWAIVENTTDEDWENVQLALVAGRPVSFQMDLYEPLYVYRPEIPVPQVPGVMPREYAEGASWAVKDKLAEVAKRDMDRGDGKAGRPGAPREAEKSESPAFRYKSGSGGVVPQQDALSFSTAITPEDMTKYAAQSQAKGADIGEVFQYQMKTPVSIARQRSAMLPILASGIEGRRVSIFNKSDGAEHPMRGVEIKNTSGSQLMPGPISVFDGAAYAGDAQIGHVTLNDKRLLAYSVDLDVQALVKNDGAATVRKIKIVNGLLEETIKREVKTSYAFANKDEKRGRQVIIEHAKTPGWDLVEPKKAAEETEALYRFELSLAAKESGKVDVAQERIDHQQYSVTQYDMPTLLAYAKDGKASKAVVDAVRKAADMQGAINDTQRRIQQLDEEKTGIDGDQNRLRQNMNSVARDTDLYKRYMTKLNEQESRLEAIRDQREKEVATLNKQQADLNAYIAALSVE